jgi:multicomponent Na+:H+ antiporter subunit B
MTQHMVLRVISKILIPLILLFALYVQFHGDYGPGGGFQAGVIFAAGIILYALVFSLERAEKTVPLESLQIHLAVGVLLFGGVGVLCLLEGGNFLDYNVLSSDPDHPQHGQHLGILLIEFGVGLTVTAAMTTIFFAFAKRERTR